MIEDEIKNRFKNYDIFTKEFTLNGVHTFARVVNVIDGDTIVCIIPLFNQYFKFSIRLNGIDTFEIKSKNPKLKHIALQAKNKLLNLIINKNDDFNSKNYTTNETINILNEHVYIVWLECINFDKYGRVLADVKLTQNDEHTFSTIMINSNLAYKYNGHTKLTEDEQVKLIETK